MSRKREISKRFKFLWAVLKKFDEDHGFFLSAGITFNLLICLVPLILLLLAVVSSYLYSDREGKGEKDFLLPLAKAGGRDYKRFISNR